MRSATGAGSARATGYSFADYARFLIANPGWPEEDKLRRWAERAMRPGENGTTVLAFFAKEPPTTGNGFARLADAYSTSGRAGEALAAARSAWSEADLGSDDEQAIWSALRLKLHQRRPRPSA
jgi:soluble lytic murein transglycosylase